MRNLVYHHNGKTYTQVSKAKARKAYNAGQPVALVPSNLNPRSPFVGFFIIADSDFDGDNLTYSVPKEERENFDERVYYFSLYNCVSSETGRYPNYFLIEGN